MDANCRSTFQYFKSTSSHAFLNVDTIADCKEHELKTLVCVQTPEEAAKVADIVMMLAPDEIQMDIYKEHLQNNLKENATLAFAHGLNIHYSLIEPRADLDVVMIAPKGPGHTVRAEYQKGR